MSALQTMTFPTRKSVRLRGLADEWREAGRCPNPYFLRGVCGEHGQVRIGVMPCGRRDCEVCGAARRAKNARRIEYGIRLLWPAALAVLSFQPEEPENDCPGHRGEAPWADCLVCKKWATRQLSYLVREVRKVNPEFQYAATFEKHKSGRLHINVVGLRWTRLEQPVLERLWGRRLSVSWISDADSAAAEATKRGKRKASVLSAYLTKLDQMVSQGRSVSFSRGFPRLPKPDVEREGEVHWRPLTDEEYYRLMNDSETGWVTQNGDAGVIAGAGLLVNELDQGDEPLCRCFDFKFDARYWDDLMHRAEARDALRHLDKPWLDADRPMVPAGVQKALAAELLRRKQLGESAPVIDVTRLVNAYSGKYAVIESGGRRRLRSPWWLGRGV